MVWLYAHIWQIRVTVPIIWLGNGLFYSVICPEYISLWWPVRRLNLSRDRPSFIDEISQSLEPILSIDGRSHVKDTVFYLIQIGRLLMTTSIVQPSSCLIQWMLSISAPRQPWNAESMLNMKDGHPWKALMPTEVTLSGTFNVVKALQPDKV